MSSPMSGNDTIDRVLVYCAQHGIAQAGNNNSLQVGRFKFSVDPHSTGNSIRGWILDGEDEYQFLNTTWWFSSSYTFNEGLWEHGAWDHELEEVFDRLRVLMKEHQEQVATQKQLAQEEQDRLRQERKEKFERLFK